MNDDRWLEEAPQGRLIPARGNVPGDSNQNTASPLGAFHIWLRIDGSPLQGSFVSHPRTRGGAPG